MGEGDGCRRRGWGDGGCLIVEWGERIRRKVLDSQFKKIGSRS